MNLKGKTVIVTGAARGLGRAISEELASAGANLALIDVQAGDCAETAAACAAGCYLTFILSPRFTLTAEAVNALIESV